MKRILRDPRGVFGIIVLAAALGLAVGAPFATSGDPGDHRDIVATRFLSPLTTDVHGVFHPLGTDRLGRDVWTRLIYGARVSLSVGTLAVLLSIAIGMSIGGAAGFWGGPVGTV